MQTQTIYSCGVNMSKDDAITDGHWGCRSCRCECCDCTVAKSLLTNNHQRICNGDVVVLLAEQTWGGMVAARLGCFLALREPPNPTVATGCFLGPARTTKPCKLRYKTASTSQIPRKLQYSGPFGGVLGPLRGPFGRDLGACRRNFDRFKLTIQEQVQEAKLH